MLHDENQSFVSDPLGDQPDSADGPVARRRHFVRWLALVVMLAVGLTAVLQGFFFVQAWEMERIQANFDRGAGDRTQVIERQMRQAIWMLETLATYFKASSNVSNRDFTTFCEPMVRHLGGLEAIGWVPRVEDTDRSVFVEKARAMGLTDYIIREPREEEPAEARREHYPVLYLQPEENNAQFLGLDLAASPDLRHTLVQAGRTGQTAMSGRFPLINGVEEQFGILLAHPVFGLLPPEADDEQRREALNGFVVMMVRLVPFVETALADLKPFGIDIRLIDLTAPPLEKFLYFHASRTRGEVDPVEENRGTSFVVVDKISLGGRDWQIRHTAAPGFLQRSRTWRAWIVLGGGLFSLLLLVGLFLANLLWTRRVEAVVTLRTRDLDEANRQLMIRAETDPLTGLYNRWAVYQKLRLEYDPERLEELPTAFFMVDLDHFKRVNDEFGHDAGDRVLVETAQRLKHAFRQVDIVSRIGGEEFLVIAPAVDQEHLPKIAERARAMIAEKPFDLEHAHEVHITASFGVCYVVLTGDWDFTEYLKRADRAMYASKKAGRNRVTILDD